VSGRAELYYAYTAHGAALDYKDLLTMPVVKAFSQKKQ
jgi:hypothetical protein